MGTSSDALTARLESRYSPDVVNEVAILGPALELLDAHEIDERRRVRDHPEESAARLDLDHVDAALEEAGTIVECLTAHHAHVMSARRESRGELIGQALRAAHWREGAFGEEDPHWSVAPGAR